MSGNSEQIAFENWFLKDGETCKLDYQRLYVTNLPDTLTAHGLNRTFSKFGKLVESYLSNTGQRKFALIKYGTAAEAWTAMTTLNNKEPLLLNICIAKKSPKRPKIKKDEENTARCLNESVEKQNGFHSRQEIVNPAQVSPDMLFNENMSVRTLKLCGKEMWENETEFDSECHDPDIIMDMKKLRLLQAEILYKQRLRDVQATGKLNNASRHIMPDGKVVLNNNTEEDTMSLCVDLKSKPSCLSKASCLACGEETALACTVCRAVPFCSAICFNLLKHNELCTQIIDLRRDAVLKHIGNNTNDGHDGGIPPLRQPHNLVQNSRQNRTQNDAPRMQPVENFNNYTHSKTHFKSNSSNNYNNYGKARYVKCNEPPRRPYIKPKTALAVTNNTEIDEHLDEENAQTAVVPIQNASRLQLPEVSKPITQCTISETKEPVTKLPPAPVEVKEKASPQKTTTLSLPANCLIDILQMEELIIMTVESACAGDGGLVCVTLSESSKEQYGMMFEELTAACEGDSSTFMPQLGEACCVYVTEDKAWYRARYLGDNRSALIDAGRIVVANKYRKLQDKFSKVPEFTCELQGAGAVGAQLLCTLLRRTGDGVEVSLQDLESGDEVGSGVVCRWSPPYTRGQAAAATEVCIPRDDLRNGMEAVIVDVSEDSVAVVCLESCAERLNSVVHGVALYGRTASPLTSPPMKGDLLVAKFTDGVHYRALCLRTNVKKNKYLLEYVDYANRDTSSLEMLYPCPEKYSLKNEPAVVSKVTVSDGEMSSEAVQYLNKLKNEAKAVIVSLPDNAKTAPSGSRAILTLEKNKENINDKIRELSTPEWKKREMRGEDVLDSKVILFDDIESVELPSSGELRLLDANALANGRIAVCKMDEPVYDIAMKLPAKMEPYCNSKYGGKPYLPRTGEVCIAKSPSGDKWLRAVFIDCELHSSGGSACAAVLYLDSGMLHNVPLQEIRKMVPDFVDNIPALSCDIYIEGLSDKSSLETVEKIKKFLNIGGDLSSGKVNIVNCRKKDNGFWAGEVPGLMQALGLPTKT